MSSSECSYDCRTSEECLRYFNEEDYVGQLQESLDKPMPWIGMYIAAASFVCVVAMAADAINGFKRRKSWFPCKYFSLNAFSLTLLAVSMKLPVDLTAQMLGRNDKLARISSLVFMSTAMANFIPSLGSMENNEIMLNLAALGILVITIGANVCIRISQVRYLYDTEQVLPEEIGSIVIMFILLVILCSSAVMIPSAKRYIESQYYQVHKRVTNEQLSRRKLTTNELRAAVRRYWVMADCGSPQFVIGRSVTCITSGVMSLLTALTLLEARIRTRIVFRGENRTESDYKWSINWILYIQFIGVALGTIPPLLRWFNAAHIKSSKIGSKSLKDEFKVEAYWTSRLKQWRDSPLPSKIRHPKFKKLLHDARRLLLNFCIVIQILIVVVSKLQLLISAIVLKGLVFCFRLVRNLKSCYSEELYSSTEFESRTRDFSCYVLLLEGEAELPKRTLMNMLREVDKLIEIGKNKKFKFFINLLDKSVNFNGVREFDSNEIRSLSSQEPPNCWSLSVVTLTSIAISLPNITDQKRNHLLSAVSESLYFAKIIEKCLDKNGELKSIHHASDVVWLGVELYRNWQDKDLKGKTQKETAKTI